MSWAVQLSNNSYRHIPNTAWVRTRLCKLQKGCTRLAAASDKVYQLLAHGRWFSSGTPAFSNTKTGRHDIAEILLKVELNTINQINQSNLSNVLVTIRYKTNSKRTYYEILYWELFTSMSLNLFIRILIGFSKQFPFDYNLIKGRI
jgi:hypothetical protein